MDEIKQLYDDLVSNGIIDPEKRSFEDFANTYSTKAKQKELYQLFHDNGVTRYGKDSVEFFDKYFPVKKKVDPASTGSGPISDPSSDGAKKSSKSPWINPFHALRRTDPTIKKNQPRPKQGIPPEEFILDPSIPDGQVPDSVNAAIKDKSQFAPTKKPLKTPEELMAESMKPESQESTQVQFQIPDVDKDLDFQQRRDKYVENGPDATTDYNEYGEQQKKNRGVNIEFEKNLLQTGGRMAGNEESIAIHEGEWEMSNLKEYKKGLMNKRDLLYLEIQSKYAPQLNVGGVMVPDLKNFDPEKAPGLAKDPLLKQYLETEKLLQGVGEKATNILSVNPKYAERIEKLEEREARAEAGDNGMMNWMAVRWGVNAGMKAYKSILSLPSNVFDATGINADRTDPNFLDRTRFRVADTFAEVMSYAPGTSRLNRELVEKTVKDGAYKYVYDSDDNLVAIRYNEGKDSGKIVQFTSGEEEQQVYTKAQGMADKAQYSMTGWRNYTDQTGQMIADVMVTRALMKGTVGLGRTLRGLEKSATGGKALPGLRKVLDAHKYDIAQTVAIMGQFQQSYYEEALEQGLSRGDASRVALTKSILIGAVSNFGDFEKTLGMKDYRALAKKTFSKDFAKAITTGKDFNMQMKLFYRNFLDEPFREVVEETVLEPLAENMVNITNNLLSSTDIEVQSMEDLARQAMTVGPITFIGTFLPGIRGNMSNMSKFHKSAFYAAINNTDDFVDMTKILRREYEQKGGVDLKKFDDSVHRIVEVKNQLEELEIPKSTEAKKMAVAAYLHDISYLNDKIKEATSDSVKQQYEVRKAKLEQGLNKLLFASKEAGAEPATEPPVPATEPAVEPAAPTQEPAAPTAEPAAPTAEPAAPTAEPAAPPVEPAKAPTAEPAAPTAEPAAPTPEPAAPPVEPAKAPTAEPAAPATEPAKAPTAEPAAPPVEPAKAPTAEPAAPATEPNIEGGKDAEEIPDGKKAGPLRERLSKEFKEEFDLKMSDPKAKVEFGLDSGNNITEIILPLSGKRKLSINLSQKEKEAFIELRKKKDAVNQIKGSDGEKAIMRLEIWEEMNELGKKIFTENFGIVDAKIQNEKEPTPTPPGEPAAPATEPAPEPTTEPQPTTIEGESDYQKMGKIRNVPKERVNRPSKESVTKYRESSKVEDKKQSTWIDPDSVKHKGVWKVVDANMLNFSHDPHTFAQRMDFPMSEIGRTGNDRDYTTLLNQTKVKEYGDNFTSQAIQTPIIVSSEGVVLSGNNRSMSRILAAENKSDADYMQELLVKAKEKGLDIEAISNMVAPTLVFEVEYEGEYTTDIFTTWNKSEGKEPSFEEKLAQISSFIKPTQIKKLAKAMSEYDSVSDFLKKMDNINVFLNIMLESKFIGTKDLSKYVMETDKETGAIELTADGKFLLDAVLASTYLDTDNLGRIRNDKMKLYFNKLSSIAAVILDNVGNKQYSLKNEINGALRILSDMNKQNMDITLLIMQPTLFGGKGYSKPDMALAILLTKKTAIVKEAFITFNNNMFGKGEQSMFDDKPTKDELFIQIMDYMVNKGLLTREERAAMDLISTGKTPNVSDTRKMAGKPKTDKQIRAGKIANLTHKLKGIKPEELNEFRIKAGLKEGSEPKLIATVYMMAKEDGSNNELVKLIEKRFNIADEFGKAFSGKQIEKPLTEFADNKNDRTLANDLYFDGDHLIADNVLGFASENPYRAPVIGTREDGTHFVIRKGLYNSANRDAEKEFEIDQLNEKSIESGKEIVVEHNTTNPPTVSMSDIDNPPKFHPNRVVFQKTTNIPLPTINFVKQLRRFVKDFDLTIHFTKWRGGILGSYSPLHNTVDLGSGNNIETMMHELGHKMDFLKDIYAKVEPNSIIEAQVMDLSRYGSPINPKLKEVDYEAYRRKKMSEGFAELMVAYLNDPIVTRQKYGELLDLFMENLSDKQIKAMVNFSRQWINFCNTSDTEKAFAWEGKDMFFDKNMMVEKLRKVNPYIKFAEGKFNFTVWDKLAFNFWNPLAHTDRAVNYLKNLYGENYSSEHDPTFLAKAMLGVNAEIDGKLEYGLTDRSYSYYEVQDQQGNKVRLNLAFLMNPFRRSTMKETERIKKMTSDMAISYRALEISINEAVFSPELLAELAEDMEIEYDPDKPEFDKEEYKELKREGREDEYVLSVAEATEEVKNNIIDVIFKSYSGFDINRFEDMAQLVLRVNEGSFPNDQPITDIFRHSVKRTGTIRREEISRHVNRIREKYFPPDGLNISQQDVKDMYEGMMRQRVFSKYLMKYAMDSGIISAKEIATMERKNKTYVPFRRVQTGKTMIVESTFKEEDQQMNTVNSYNMTDVVNPLKRRKGSESRIEDPYISLIQNVYSIHNEVAKNDFLSAFADLLDRPVRLPGAFDYSPPVREVGMIGKRVSSSVGGEHTITVKRAGKNVTYNIDGEIHNELMRFYESGVFSKNLKFLTIPATLVRSGTTNSPRFAARNSFRDTWHRLTVSRTGGPIDYIGMGKYKEMYEISGAKFSGYYLRNREDYYEKLFNEMNKTTKSKNNIVFLGAKRFLKYKVRDPWTNLMAKSESLNRIAEFKSAHEKALSKGYSYRSAMLYAMYQSRDLMDFAVAGHVMKSINQVIPFSNAQVQGIRRTLKAIFEVEQMADDARLNDSLTKEKSIEVGKKMAIFTGRLVSYSVIPSVATWITSVVGGYEDEYLSLPSTLRDLYWCFKIPGHAEWIALPKPFEIGVLASGIERIIVEARHPEKGFDSEYWDTFGEILMPISRGDALFGFKSVIEIITNYDSWRDRHIISMEEADKEIKGRKGTKYASNIGKGGSAVINGISTMFGAEPVADPRMVDYFVQAQFGDLGRFAVKVSGNTNNDKAFPLDWTDSGFGKKVNMAYSENGLRIEEMYRKMDIPPSGEYAEYRNEVYRSQGMNSKQLNDQNKRILKMQEKLITRLNERKDDVKLIHDRRIELDKEMDKVKRKLPKDEKQYRAITGFTDIKMDGANTYRNVFENSAGKYALLEHFPNEVVKQTITSIKDDIELGILKTSTVKDWKEYITKNAIENHIMHIDRQLGTEQQIVYLMFEQAIKHQLFNNDEFGKDNTPYSRDVLMELMKEQEVNTWKNVKKILKENKLRIEI